jgi:glycosyltransferase involved in cell wall biosynthesis
MRIALYNLTTTTKFGGVESFVWDLARGLASRSHDVTIIGGAGGRRERVPGVRVLTFPFVSRVLIQSLPMLRRAYAEAKLLERLSMAVAALPHLVSAHYDIIHIQKPYDLAPALLAGRLSGVRVILGCHGEDFYRGDRVLAARVDGAVSCSLFNARTVAARYGFEPQVVYNGIDTALFRPSRPDARIVALRLASGAPDAGRTPANGSGVRHNGARREAALLLWVGRLQPWKGVDVAIRALASIPRAQLVIAGDGQERAALEALVDELDLAARVHFLGEVPRAQLPGVYSAADMLLATSYASETFGIGPVEAQACGLPVVASTFGGFPEVVDAGRTGLLVPPRDPAALAAAVAGLLAQPARLRVMAEAGPAWAARFAWPAVVDRVEAAYRAALSGAAAVQPRA